MEYVLDVFPAYLYEDETHPILLTVFSSYT